MSSESEQVVASAFHAFRAQAKAERRGRNKGADRIMEAVMRRVRGELPENDFYSRFSNVPWEDR